MLADSLPALGGQAVNSIIGTFCGLFANGYDGAQITHGIADGILRDLGAQGALSYRRGGPSNTIVVMYDEIALSRWIEEAIRKADVTVLLGAVMRDVTRDGGRVRAVDFATRYGDVTVSAAGFVDASGDAALTGRPALPAARMPTGRFTAPRWWCWRASTRRAIRPGRK